MGDKEILEFIQEVSRPLSYRLYWQIPRQNNTTYQVDVDAMELAFEMSISDSLNADNSYINQLPEIKERLDNVLSKLQRRRCRYEKVANELKDNLPILSIRQKYTREQQRDADNLSHFRNIIGQFRLVLEPNIRKAIKYIDKKLKEQKAIVVVTVEEANNDDTPKQPQEAPYYNGVRYEKQYLGKIYKLAVEHHILKETNDKDFTYYFSGNGEQPSMKLEIGTRGYLDLAIFIKEFMLSNIAKKVWVISERVFNIKEGVLNPTYHRGLRKDEYIPMRDSIKQILKDIPSID